MTGDVDDAKELTGLGTPILHLNEGDMMHFLCVVIGVEQRKKKGRQK